MSRLISTTLFLFVLFFGSSGLKAQSHSPKGPDTSGAGYSQASVTVAWDPNHPDQRVTNYRVFWGTESRQYSQHVDAGSQTFKTLNSLPNDRDIYISVKAQDETGESDYSEEIVFHTPHYVPGVPPSPQIQNLSVKDENGVRNVTLDLVGGKEGRKYALEVSEDLENWTETSNVIVGEEGEVVPFPFQWPLSSAPKRMFFRFRYLE